ncbi:MAG TPA: alpha-amylase family protein [Beijerinckiaceae bacterium]
MDLWYKNAVVYCLDVETFRDSNGDGVGDFQGLTDRLDHIEALGCDCVWLLPFYPSPNRDNGYDITDFYGVDARLGSPGDVVAFMRAARDRGLKVLVDLVVNHTSVDHPWFQAARSDPKSPYRDWYIWSEEKPHDADEGVVFPGVQHSTWSYDDVAGLWYMHRFYEHQPDLNAANPQVRAEIEKIMGYWLELGVSGFRVDAVPFLIEHRGLPEDQKPKEDPHRYLTQLRDFLAWRKASAILLAEANIPMEQVEDYFGPEGDRMHVIFNFMLNQNLFLSLVRGDAEPMRRVMASTPALPEKAQWATFLRNHDELDLGRLSDAERQECFAALGPEPHMQLYARGVRRRLAPMLGGDARKLRLAFSLMFALPGTPVIWYGEEIGMGDDLSLKERNAVRTPMQWTEDRNGGFSEAPSDALIRPLVCEGPFAFDRVNVQRQHDLDGSLLVHVQRLVRVRRACPEIGWGTCTPLDVGDSRVLALRYDWNGRTVVVLNNVSDADTEAALDVEGAGRLRPLLCVDENRDTLDARSRLPMPAYGFRWFRALPAEA